jgi:hypothetical protein
MDTGEMLFHLFLSSDKSGYSPFQQAALVLNASRRFRYTLDLKKEEEKEMIRRKIRAHAQVIRAAFLFKEAGEKDLRGTISELLLPFQFMSILKNLPFPIALFTHIIYILVYF